MTELRKCYACGRELPLSSYHRTNNKSGYSYKCKECVYQSLLSYSKVDDMPGEIWKQIKDFPCYEVSNLGRVKRVRTQTGNKTDKLMTPTKINKMFPYHLVQLQGKRRYIHRLVASAFIPNPDNLPQVNHKDGNKINNHVDNLEWVTASQNGKHAYDVLGIVPNTLGRFGKEANRHRGVRAIKGAWQKDYDTITEASKELGINTGSITRCARGEWSHTHGYKFEYLK